MEATEAQVFQKVSACLNRLVGSSGHLASFAFEPGTFEVSGTRSLSNGLTEYAFRGVGRYETEFATHVEASDGEEVQGSIVLDPDLALTFDDVGRVRVTPGPILHPTRWQRPDDPTVQAEDAEAMTKPATRGDQER